MSLPRAGMAAGTLAVRLSAALNALPFWRAMGFGDLGPREFPTAGGRMLEVRAMRKALG